MGYLNDLPADSRQDPILGKFKTILGLNRNCVEVIYVTLKINLEILLFYKALYDTIYFSW